MSHWDLLMKDGDLYFPELPNGASPNASLTETKGILSSSAALVMLTSAPTIGSASEATHPLPMPANHQNTAAAVVKLNNKDITGGSDKESTGKRKDMAASRMLSPRPPLNRNQTTYSGQQKGVLTRMVEGSATNDEKRQKSEQSMHTGTRRVASKQRKGKEVQLNEHAPKTEYVHIRAARGHATSRHSIAERARREKIEERMKLLQDIVPGCRRVTGKAVMLDEIINYILSLQVHVEYLAAKVITLTEFCASIMDHYSNDMHQPSTNEGTATNMHAQGMNIPKTRTHAFTPEGILQPEMPGHCVTPEIPTSHNFPIFQGQDNALPEYPTNLNFSIFEGQESTLLEIPTGHNLSLFEGQQNSPHDIPKECNFPIFEGQEGMSNVISTGHNYPVFNGQEVIHCEISTGHNDSVFETQEGIHHGISAGHDFTVFEDKAGNSSQIPAAQNSVMFENQGEFPQNPTTCQEIDSWDDDLQSIIETGFIPNFDNRDQPGPTGEN